MPFPDNTDERVLRASAAGEAGGGSLCDLAWGEAGVSGSDLGDGVHLGAGRAAVRRGARIHGGRGCNLRSDH